MTMLGVGGCDLVVLCGGFGTRLRPVVSDRPKVMALIHDRPFLDFILEYFVAHGSARIILCTGYLGEQIAQRYAGIRHPYEVVISHEPFPMGTAGAVKHAAALIQSEHFMVVNGDSLIEIDLNQLLDFHAAKQGLATIALASAGSRIDVGFVTVNSHAQVTAFTEKQPGTAPQYHNAGLYVFRRDVLKDIPDHRLSSLERDVLPALRPRGVYGFVSAAALYDIGTPERLAEFASSRHEWRGGVLS